MGRARTNRSKCFSCKKQIPVGSERGICITHVEKQWKRFLCKNCSKIEIKDDIERCEEELKRLKEMKLNLN